MKLYITRDRRGRLRALAVPAPTSDGVLRVSADPGHVVSEVDVDIKADPADREAFAAELSRIADRFRSEAAPRPGGPPARARPVSRRVADARKRRRP